MELSGKRVLIPIGPDYQDLEVWYPKLRLTEAGAEVKCAGIGEEIYHGKNGYPIKVDLQVEECSADDFDAVIIPGGWAPDKIRMNEHAVDIVRTMFNDGKVVAAICHAGWVLVSAGILEGKKVTSYAAIKDDMIAAGADWNDGEVIVDGNLITSRKPDDLPAFCREIIALLGSKN
ncbi:MAG: type 1 glutamine amidotransferase [Candidatus Marinimicrobia bacterium]|nr:type 1 glutamine amidotransferase [Candidatus Neomarinimicrobiota bacterium]